MSQPVRDYMTPVPVTIQQDETLLRAHRLMDQHGVRHLPVLDGEALVGVVSDRDLHLLETLKEVSPETELVEEAMTSEPFSVPPDAPVAAVVAEMARHKYGSALVVEGSHVVGIFTTTDALFLLARVLPT